MHVEECCQALLAEMLPVIDSSRSGLAIDIGVGNFALYCLLFDQLRFKTIAIEPLPSDFLRKLCRYRNIKLLENCVSDQDGVVDLYIGKDTNLNSLRSDWWGCTVDKKQINSVTFLSLIETIHASEISCVKIDVEGIEHSIIKQFSSLETSLLPKVLMFEYGGGGTKENQAGGWSKETFESTLNSLGLLKKLGYNQTIVIEYSPGTKEKIVDLNSLDFNDLTHIFSPESVYGNIITLRGSYFFDETTINKICQPYRDNELIPPSIVIKESLSVRFLRRLRSYFNRISEINAK